VKSQSGRGTTVTCRIPAGQLGGGDDDDEEDEAAPVSASESEPEAASETTEAARVDGNLDEVFPKSET